jgi:hypothetical protein
MHSVWSISPLVFFEEDAAYLANRNDLNGVGALVVERV